MKSWFLKWGLLTILVFAGQNDKTLSFETSEGTLISVDVSPNGKTIAFDLLGHIYLMPSNGGNAEAITKGTSWMRQQYRRSPARCRCSADPAPGAARRSGHAIQRLVQNPVRWLPSPSPRSARR